MMKTTTWLLDHIVKNFEQIALSKVDFARSGKNNCVRYNIPINYLPTWPVNVFECASTRA